MVVVMARGRFKSLSVSDTVYNKLREIAERRGFSTLADTVAYLVSLEELVVRRLESITTSTGNVTTNTGNVTGNSGNVTTSTGNVTSSTGNITTNAGNVETSSNTITAGEGYEWCRSKTRVRSLQSFIKWVDERFELVDWWDEGDRYCFKTRKKPAKTE